jgi:vancomycin permeability regulator SanA
MIIRLLLTLILAGIFILLFSRTITALYSWSRIYNLEGAPSKPAAIVFGAGLWYDGSPSPVLRDRISAAAQLYFDGKVQKLLMSGDNRFIDYNEPGAMREYALGLGVPDDVIVLDFAGRRTYDTCYRAKAIFGLQEAILVTQSFHLPRAIYTCNQLGLPAVGVSSDMRTYLKRAWIYWQSRELFATLAALWEVHVTHPLPVLGEPEPIFPTEAQ